MIEIRDAVQSDYDEIKKNPLHPELLKAWGNIQLQGWCKALIVDEQLICIGGIHQYWDGVGEGWLAVHICASDERYKAASAIKRLIKRGILELGLWRLQATVKVDYDQPTRKILEQAGFDLEGVMHKYTPDKKDAYLYAYLTGE